LKVKTSSKKTVQNNLFEQWQAFQSINQQKC